MWSVESSLWLLKQCGWDEEDFAGMGPADRGLEVFKSQSVCEDI